MIVEKKALFLSPTRELHFEGLRGEVTASSLDEVAPALAEVEAAVGEGLCAAGYLSYEAAPGLNRELETHCRDGAFPLVWFGLYERHHTAEPGQCPAAPCELGGWTPEIDRRDYEYAMARIRAYLEAGDTYQVNYTFGLTAAFQGDSEAWFRALCHAQQAPYCAYLDLGRFQIVSVSPELFFRLRGEVLETRPMKGTRPRGADPAEDTRLRDELAASAKDQAENVMIVDLLRNDMGRVSRTGSVEVTDLFRVEAYPTVWQMTSSIRSRTSAPISEIVRALFPCGSVTGAPKMRTMQIIREVEGRPRGAYCGAVGWWMPGRRAEFSVAIRTATVDAERGRARYCVGSGVTWYSTSEDEYDECLLKAAVLDVADGRFELIEALLFDGEYFLLERHLSRLAGSADYFGFAFDIAAIRAALVAAGAAMPSGPRKVRLIAGRTGAFHIEHAPAEPIERLRMAVAESPVDERDLFLRHKTTRRGVYEKAKAAHPDADDVLLWNSRGEITETCLGNVVAELDGRLVTPPVSCGLLPGTMRADLIEKGIISEFAFTREHLARASAVYMVNSVRKWVPLDLFSGTNSREKCG